MNFSSGRVKPKSKNSAAQPTMFQQNDPYARNLPYTIRQALAVGSQVGSPKPASLGQQGEWPSLWGAPPVAMATGGTAITYPTRQEMDEQRGVFRPRNPRDYLYISGDPRHEAEQNARELAETERGFRRAFGSRAVPQNRAGRAAAANMSLQELYDKGLAADSRLNSPSRYAQALDLGLRVGAPPGGWMGPGQAGTRAITSAANYARHQFVSPGIHTELAPQGWRLGYTGGMPGDPNAVQNTGALANTYQRYLSNSPPSAYAPGSPLAGLIDRYQQFIAQAGAGGNPTPVGSNINVQQGGGFGPQIIPPPGGAPSPQYPGGEPTMTSGGIPLGDDGTTPNPNQYVANAARLLGPALAGNPFITPEGLARLRRGYAPLENEIMPAFYRYTSPVIQQALMGLRQSVGYRPEEQTFTAEAFRPRSLY